MFQTAIFRLVANRFTPFFDTIEVRGADFTGADFKMQVRDAKDGGAIRADLDKVVTDIEGVRLVDVSTVDDQIVSTLAIVIDEATMEAMPGVPEGMEPGADVSIYWDLHITPAAERKFVAFAGEFKIRAGVTE